MEVYVVGIQTVLQTEIDRFVRDHVKPQWRSDGVMGSQVLVELAGRLCYMSYAQPRPGGNAAYIRHLIEVGHGSVLEHAVFSFIITGVSRSLTHELVRHRHMSFSQLSQRYVDESVAEYVEPAIIAQDKELHDLWQSSITQCHQTYIELSGRLAAKLSQQEQSMERSERRKTARQAARSVLPNATETKIFVTANARELRHFFEVRANRHADIEIRKLAVMIYDAIYPLSQNIFGDYVKVQLEDGTFELQTPYRKV